MKRGGVKKWIPMDGVQKNYSCGISCLVYEIALKENLFSVKV